MSKAKPIGYTITHRFPGVDISEQELANLLAIASWQCTPKFPRRGRMAWHVLEEAASLVADPSYKLRAAKLKGVGAWNQPSFHGQSTLDSFPQTPIPPTTQPFDSRAKFPHFGFTAEGEYTFLYSNVAPVGGILHSCALQEYRCAETLVKNGVPTIIPLVVVQYEDCYQFQGEPMGAVISLVPNTPPYRLSKVTQFEAATQQGENSGVYEYYERVRKSLRIEGEPDSETTRLQTINILTRKIGKLIHDFTAAGLYRYSSGWSNFEYNFDRREILLTDLDSTRYMDELADEFRTLQALRDLASMVHRSLLKFYYDLSVLDRYTIKNILKYDSLFELILGYFPDAPEEEVKQISRKLWNFFIPYLFLHRRYRQAIQSGSFGGEGFLMDHQALFYILAMTSLYPLFCKSDIFRLYPSNLNLEQLMKKAEVYLGENYEYFLYLLDGGTFWGNDFDFNS